MARKHSMNLRRDANKRRDDHEREARVAELTRRLNSETHYYSESQGCDVPIAWMPIPHAEHALAKLERQYGDEVHETPLAQALQRRIDQAGHIDINVRPAEDTAMMRGDNGRFTGAVKITRRSRS